MVVFKLAIVRSKEAFGDEETIVVLPGGGKLEQDLVASITAEVMKHIGMLNTRGSVLHALNEGVTQSIMNLKEQTIHVL